MPKTYLVTGATGKQGAAVSRQLNAQGHTLKCLVRDPSSPEAQSLQNDLGASLVEGSLEDADTLKQAAHGCDGIFLVTQPSGDEALQARNVIAAAEASNVQILVASTVVHAEQHESFPHWHDNCILASYWKGKAAVQQAVRASNIPHWTILQPAWMMSDMISPVSSFFWPELAAEKTILTAFGANTNVPWTNEADIGSFGAAALTSASVEDKQKWDKKHVPVASQLLTIGQVAETMSTVAGKEVSVQFRPNDEVEQLAEKSPTVWTQRWQRDGGLTVDVEKVHSYGLPLHDFADFLQEHKSDLDKALGGA